MLGLADTLEAFSGDDIRAFGLLLKRSHGLVAAGAQNPYLPLAMAPLHGLSRRSRFGNLRDVAADLRDGADKLRRHPSSDPPAGLGDGGRGFAGAQRLTSSNSPTAPCGTAERSS